MRPKIGKRDTLITFQLRTGTQEPIFGTWEYVWSDVADEWADVQDMLGSERTAEGLDMANRPAQIRTLYRDDVTSDMRVKIGSRLMQIVRGPIELGRRDGLQLICEDYSSEGEAP